MPRAQRAVRARAVVVGPTHSSLRCETPAMPDVTSVDGATIAYTVRGDGPAVVLVPGVGMPGTTFPDSLVSPLLDGGRTVVAIDPRETGASSRDAGPPVDLMSVFSGDHATAPFTMTDLATDVLAVLDALDISSATFLGHSMGGNCVMAIQALAPQRVDAIVLLSSTPGIAIEQSPELMSLMLREAPADREDAIAWLVEINRLTMGQFADPEKARIDAGALIDDTGWWGVSHQQIAALIIGTPGLAARTPEPATTTIIMGGDDKPDAARELARSIGCTNVLVLEGYAHWFPEPGPWAEIATAVLHAPA